MHWKRFGVLGVLMVKIVIVIFYKFRKALLGQNTRFDVGLLLAQIGLRVWLGARPWEAKNCDQRPSWIFIFFFIFFIIGHICWSALESTYVKFDDDRYYGSKVISIYVFHRKCNWKCPKIGVLWILGGENCNIYLSNPQNALAWPKTRVLRYYSPKLVYGFD